MAERLGAAGKGKGWGKYWSQWSFLSLRNYESFKERLGGRREEGLGLPS